MADNVGKIIAAAQTAPSAVAVADIIIRNAIECGPNKLPAQERFVLLSSMAAALEEWRKSLFAAATPEYEKMKEGYMAAKMELDELKLWIAVKQKEGKIQ